MTANENFEGPDWQRDLFGNLRFVGKRGRGRPAFERTEENANKVSMLLALGWSNERIRGCILNPKTGKPISESTLTRYFRPELTARDYARDQMEARRFERVWQQAEAGNVGAERLLGKMIERNDMMIYGRRIDEAQKPKPKTEQPRAEKLGKKEQQHQAALTAGDGNDWGADLVPDGWKN